MECLGQIEFIKNNIGSASVASIRAIHKLIFEVDNGRQNRKGLREFSGFTFANGSDEHDNKIKYATDTLDVNDLIAICNLLCLDYSGTKDELINKIVSGLCDINSLNKAEDETESDNDNISDGNDGNNDNVSTRSSQHEQNVDRHEHASRFPISFRDIEDTVRQFSGSDDFPVEGWVNEFEEIAEMMEWSDLHKFIFAKKSLRGLAKLYIQGEHGINSWAKLKISLLDEFSTKVNSAQLHQMLSTKKIKKGETVHEYFLTMKELANRGPIESDALIQYTINGILDENSNKTILYGARNLDEFKRKLKDYEKMKKATMKNSDVVNETKTIKSEVPKNDLNFSKNMSDIRCYSCGGKGHKSAVCKHKDKGLKCFKCNNFGHKASECKESPSASVKILTVNTKLCEKNVKINNVDLMALIDTGCAVNLLRKDLLVRIGCPELKNTDIKLIGFGGKSVNPDGTFKTKMVVDDQTFAADFYVVSQDIMANEVIIGQGLLSEVELKISREEISMSKVTDEMCIMKIDVGNNDDELNFGQISETAKNEVQKLIKEYRPLKTKSTDVEMKILMKTEEPVAFSPRRLPFSEREIVDKQVKEWIDENIVEPCTSDYASQVVVVRKKDGSPRICIDYRKVNKNIIKDKFPLPLVEDQLDRLQEARIFSTLDLKNGFFHVPVEESSRKYTTFVTHDGQYWFKKVPFGMCNSPSVFQRFINTIFRNLAAKGIALPYIDDLIIPAKDEYEAVERLKQVITVASEYGLEINYKKCQFLQRKVEFLGYVIEDGKLRPSPAKTAAVIQFPEPRSVKQVQSFLGLTGYFRKFIPNYSIIAKPLSDLLKTETKFRFESAERESFNQLKMSLTEKPVLHIYKQGAITEVHTDASIDGYGSVLLQKCQEDNCLHPVYYMSKKTSPAERKFSSYELEVLAVIEALKKFRVYLLGQKFKIVTDCNAFTKTVEKRDLITRVARWVMLLEEFDYTIEHRSGSAMRHVDALSRHPVMLIDACNEILTRMKTAQNADDHLKSIREILKERNYEDYFERNGILYRLNKGKELLVVPDDMQAEIINKAHQNGHFAVKKTEELIEREYFIPKLRSKVERCITNCVSCIMVNSKRGKKEGLLHPLKKEDTPLHTFHIDHMGPLATTNKNYNHILVVVDSFTKFVWLYPTKGTTTKEVIAKLDLQKKVFGNPYQIISDRGTAFTSAEFEEYCKDENIKHLRITAGLPRSNGQVERINEVIIPVLAKMSIEEPEKWYKHVDKVQRMINSTYQRGTGHTPMELLVGIKMRNKEDIRLKEIINEELINNFDKEREELRRNAKDQIKKMQEENKRSYNLRRKPARKYKVGDVVAIKRTQFGPGMKLKAKYLGPYKIIKVKPNNSYDVIKEGQHEGPLKTSTCAEYIKPWCKSVHDESEADSYQDGRM